MKLIFLPFLLISVSTFAQSWTLDKIAARPNRLAEERFGSVVEISGLDAFVSSSSDTDDENENPGGTKGSIYVYAKTSADASWSFVQKIKSPNSNLSFPASLSANGDYLVAGATSEGQGAAYVYKKGDDGQWGLVQTLGNISTTNDDRYGSGVSIVGNIIVITAYGLSPSQELRFCGGAYVYEKNENDAWVYKQMLTASDRATSDFLGYSVALNEDVIVLGAPGEGISDQSGTPNRGHGAVYVYRKQSGTWIETNKITKEVRIPFASFGDGMSMSGNSIIVASKTGRDIGYLTASFYEIDKDKDPVFKGEFVTDFPLSYGVDVDISGNLAMLSLPAEAVRSAYTFKRDDATSNWEAGPTIYSPNFDVEFSKRSESFGWSISISGGDILIGSPLNDVDGGPGVVTNSGVAYFFKNTGKPPAFTKTFYPELTGDFFNANLIDFDNDGDLDLFGHTSLYRQDPDGFTKVRTFPPATISGTTVWLDANNDGWLDLFSRHSVSYPFVGFNNRLYVNQRDGTFEERVITFPGDDNSFGRLTFADYDNDGDPDILMQVDTYEEAFMYLFRNEGDFTFVESKITFRGYGIVASEQPWFDFNNDGFLDFVTINNHCSNIVYLHINNNGTSFTSSATNASAMDGTEWGVPIWGSMVLADYDNDGDDDFIWTGNRSCESSPMHTGVINNTGTNLVDSPIKFRGFITYATIVPGDFNNDGISDMVTVGARSEVKPDMELFLGNGTDFDELRLYESPWSNLHQGLDVGDVDNDGDLDLFIFGQPESYPYTTKAMICMNNAAQGWTKKNEPPAVPSQPAIGYSEDLVTLTWNEVTDDSTPSKALTYNLLITKDDSVILNTYSNLDGSRQRYVPGNAGHRTFMHIRNLKPGIYKASVQAIDNSFAGSLFSSPLEFTIGGITGLESITFEDLKIYPIPANNEMFIENKSGDEFSFSIIDTIGKKCNSMTSTSILERINLTDFAPGIYFARIVKNGRTTLKRLVKK